jgi:hypothetical protein
MALVFPDRNESMFCAKYQLRLNRVLKNRA